MSNFSERLKLAEEYHKWRQSQKGFEVKDCAESVIAFIEPKLCQQKDTRIAELEKELKDRPFVGIDYSTDFFKMQENKAVKEFAEEILNMWSNYSAKEETDIFNFYYKFQDNIKQLLKEMGIN